MSSSTSKSFLIKDILSENSESISSDESNDNKEIFSAKPIDLRRYFKHPLCPIPLRPSALLLTKPTTTTATAATTLRNGHRLDNDKQNSPLNALFEMTKKTFDKSDLSKSNLSIENWFAFFSLVIIYSTFFNVMVKE